jgi:hypothetical protein
METPLPREQPMAGRQSFAVAIYGVSAADQHVHGWDARRASHVTGFMAAPTSRCQLDLILFLVDSAASVEANGAAT